MSPGRESKGRQVDVLCLAFSGFTCMPISLLSQIDTDFQVQLSYTRGSIIPLHLVIQSHNIQALETLSAPQAIICRLRRNIRYVTQLVIRAYIHDFSLLVDIAQKKTRLLTHISEETRWTILN